MTIYNDCVEAGIPVRNHYSDLYIPVTPATTALVEKYQVYATTFPNQVEGGTWYDVAFAYDPYWIERNMDVNLSGNNKAKA